MNKDINAILNALQKSSFRRSFHLKKDELAYLQQKGMESIRLHAADFISSRLAPANPNNDGKQTPFQGHPVFVAQHATATCCRACLLKWHKLPKDKALNEEEQHYIVAIIDAWLQTQIPTTTALQQSLNFLH